MSTRTLARAEWRRYCDSVSKQIAGRQVALDGIAHSILAPREIVLEETERGLVDLEVVAADDTVATLRFREPLHLKRDDVGRDRRAT